MTLREYIIFWQETYDKHQSRPTTYAAHNYVFKNHIERQNLLQIAEDKNFLNSDADLDSFIDGLETALIISMLVEDDTNEFMHPGETPQGIRKFTLGGE